MSKSFFIDTTLCTGCRGCQVACKQWHDLPAEETVNRGSFENPANLSFNTYKLVRMREEEIGGKLSWLFFPEQCRHCQEAPCLDEADDPSAIFRDSETGAVIFTANTKQLDADAIIEACPYNIPRKSEDGTLAKCDMCLDRVQNGKLPSCVQTCPTGTMGFGDTEEMRALADKRLGEARKKFPGARLLEPDDLQVIYLVSEDPRFYHEYAAAPTRPSRIMTRQVALRKMFKPLTRLFS